MTKYLATITKTIELQVVVYASSSASVRNHILDMGDIEFPHREIIESEVNIEPLEE